MPEVRGSEKLYAAYRTRTLTDESVKVISQIIDESSATVQDVAFFGGEDPTGMSMSVAFDDGEGCGNNIVNLLGWLHHYGNATLSSVVIFPRGILGWDRTIVEVNAGTNAGGVAAAGAHSADATA